MTEIMTLNEFKKAIEDWGKSWGIETEFVIDASSVCVYAKRRNKDFKLVATISNTEPYIFDFYKLGTVELRHTMRKPLLEIVTKFANTWPADRKDKEKKFYLKHKFINTFGSDYLIHETIEEKYFLGNEIDTPRNRTKFTLDEIEEIKMIYDTDLKDFELIEVKENEN